MKRYFPKNAEDASALILTLLVIVLLSAIVTSFLSSTRTEQTATRNYTSKTQAEQFASSATQRAMATLQSAFNGNGSMSGNYTGVVTSQPGAIKKFFFQNGNCTKNATTNLFFAANSTNANGTVNMNNLANSTNSTIAGLITGNVSENISVYRVDVKDSSGNQTIGRIAYYVDDEGTKINLNSATSNRSGLNIANSRGLSLSALSNNTTTLAALDSIVAGNSTASTNMTTWTNFFRQEQAQKALGLTNAQIAATSVAPLRDFHMKYTPWGARRLFINDTNSTEVPLNSNGVNKIVDALSSQHLRNIYGQTFADKYNTINGSAMAANATAANVGLKQIAANMLQRKSSKTTQPVSSYKYFGPLIGGDNLDADGIPKEYLGHASFPGLNEVGISARLAVEKVGGNIKMRNILQVCIESICWERMGMTYQPVNTAKIIVELDSLTYDVNYSTTVNGSTTNSTISLGGAWPVNVTGVPFDQFCTNNNSTYTQNFGWQDDNDWKIGDKRPKIGGGYTNGADTYWTINATKDWRSNQPTNFYLYEGRTYRYHIGTLGREGRGGEISMGFSYNASSNLTIKSIDNMRASIKKIRLLGNSTDNSTIRDWVVGGRDVGNFTLTLSTANLTTANPTFFPFTANNSTTINATWADPEPVAAPLLSYGRLDPRLKSVSSLGTPATLWPAYSNSASFAWGPYGNSTWGNSQTILMRGYGFSGEIFIASFNTGGVGLNRLFTSNSSWTKNNLISGDSLPLSRSEFIIDHFNHTDGSFWLGDKGIMCWPFMYNGSDKYTGFVFSDPSGNRVFIGPSDLGTVATNYPWRTLRMQVQPQNEISSTDGGGSMATQSLIPDWAMLDVISFGMNSTTIPLNSAAHVNLNNKFVTANGTLTSNRSKSLESLLQSVDNANSSNSKMFRNSYSLTGNFALAFDVKTTCYDQLGNATANGTWFQLIASNIGNMTWSPLSFWGSNNTATKRVRKSKGFPTNHLVLPSEVSEIRDIADLVSTNSTTFESSTRYTNAARSIKSNELRLSPFFPGATTCSNFFTIYAYAQALDKAGNPDSEHLTKTLVEVEITTPATETSAAVYKVKSLYTQSIPIGE